jgi:methionyl-tRNA synthetase
MKPDNNYYLTTAIAYTSGKPHIGNIYEIVLADAIARRKRQEGYNVFFMTGTDEHGQKIEEKAKAAGKEPQAFVDEVAGVIQRPLRFNEHVLRQVHPYHRSRSPAHRSGHL